MPGVSTNRDRAIPFRGHRRYFHSPSRLGRWRTRLCLLAFLLSVGWVAAGFVDQERIQNDVSHGPLIEAHSTWASRCDACHIPFGEPGNEAAGLFSAGERWRAFRCNGCHPGPEGDSKNYAPHYVSSEWKADARSRDCSSCHHDHQGKNFALARVSDSECVRCHGDLQKLHAAQDGTYDGPKSKIGAFHTDHPEFRVKSETAKRGLKFNHGVHMALGLTPSGANANAMFKLKDVDTRFAKQYSQFASPAGSAESPLRLDCAACHQLDTGRNLTVSAIGGLPGELAFPARPAGAYYLPVTFEQHCQACHSLKTSGLSSKDGVAVEPFELPHRKKPSEIEKLIFGEVARQVTAKDKLLLKAPMPPNDRLDSPRSVDVPASLRDAVNELSEKTTRLIFSEGYSCRKCHTVTGEKTIVPNPSPTIWMPNGRFDHSKHRVVNCAECHSMWDQLGEVKRLRADSPPEAINLPGVDTCRKCHSPAGTKDGKAFGGVKHDCIDCHRYHGASFPLQGPGSPHRTPPADGRFNIDTFLRGPRTKEAGR